MPGPQRSSHTRQEPIPSALPLTRTRSMERVLHLSFLITALEAIVILGVNFRAQNPFRPVIHPLSVTVVDTRSHQPPRAVTIYAQNRSRGGGNRIQHLLHAAFLPSGQINQSGARQGSGIRDVRPRHQKIQRGSSPSRYTRHGQGSVIVSRRDTARLVRSGTRGNPAPSTEVLDVRELRVASDANLPPATDPFRRKSGSDRIRRRSLPSIAARSLDLARYLDLWRRRVERIGNQLLERQGPLADFRGHLLLAVSLRANGSIANIQFMRASHNPNLNRLALETLHRAEPFPPLPARQSQQTLHFVYEWVFSQNTLRTDTP